MSNGRSKRKLIMFMSDFNARCKNLIAATLSWVTQLAGRDCELYYECPREGELFSTYGSTVIGGHQREAFYFLQNNFDVKYVLWGKCELFLSALKSAHSEIIVQTDNIIELYQKVFAELQMVFPDNALFVGEALVDNKKLPDASAYLYPEIFFTNSVALPAKLTGEESAALAKTPPGEVRACNVSDAELKAPAKNGIEITSTVEYKLDAGYQELSTAVARKWIDRAQGVAFCDPALASFVIPWLARHKKIVLFSEKLSDVLEDIIELVETCGNNVLYGRQTSDSDILYLSPKGIAFQILEPNRPQFPVVEMLDYQFHVPKSPYYEKEPSDDELAKYADEGKILVSFVMHGGDLAHTDAVYSLLDLVAMRKIKMAFGISAARFQYSPDVIEHIFIDRDRGGCFPYIEPVIHSGGMGVIAEVPGYNNTADIVKHWKNAAQCLRKILPESSMPVGYYAFCDSDPDTFTATNPDLYKALKREGFQYAISSALPGRNKIIFAEDNFLTLNQSIPWRDFWSPFVRVNSLDELRPAEHVLIENNKPGWILATLDSPVWAYPSYIWQVGYKIDEMFAYVLAHGKAGKLISVIPHTIYRYAKILKQKGIV